MDGKTTYYQRNRKIILNRPKGYYEYNKDRIRDQARNKYWELMKKKKIKIENMKEIDTIMYPKKINKD